jgi:hypothetical protein
MTNTIQDFVGTTKTVHAKIKGIKGYLITKKVGTVGWMIQDDQGRNHRFDIPGTYLVPDLPIRLLSPQHLAREMATADQEPDGTACHTYSDRVIPRWHHEKYRCPIPLGKSNVPVIRSGPAYTSFEYHVKCNTTVNILNIRQLCYQKLNLITPFPCLPWTFLQIIQH